MLIEFDSQKRYRPHFKKMFIKLKMGNSSRTLWRIEITRQALPLKLEREYIRVTSIKKEKLLEFVTGCHVYVLISKMMFDCELASRLTFLVPLL